MSLEAPPPSRHVFSTPTPLTSASRLLETYLANSERHAHLHPDALVTPTGVTFSSHGGPMGGVVMHNLRRVAAGLRGEYLEPEGTPEPEEGQDAVAEGLGAGNKFGKDNGGKGGEKRKPNMTEEWQDMAEYEREEGVIEVGDVGTRSTAVQEGGQEPRVQVTGGEQEGKKRKEAVMESEAGGKLDKAARKKAKKEKNQQRKRDIEMMRVSEKNKAERDE